ncbi:MAG: hypothetical protein M3P94_03330 [Chloroflexota bacterium]|nr:hypothetical protein [Chloroflexota bacterium]
MSDTIVSVDKARFYQVDGGVTSEVDCPDKYTGFEGVIVAKTTILGDKPGGPIEVSTVKLNRWRGTGSDEWETMVFASNFPAIDQNEMVERHHSRVDAVAGHDEMVKDVMEYLDRIS